MVAAMTAKGVLPGYDLGQHFDEMKNCLLVNVTETKSDDDLARYVATLTDVLEA